MLTIEKIHPSGYWVVYGGPESFKTVFDTYAEAKLYAKVGGGLPLRDDVKTLTYHRNPTPDELKQGYGATHYRDFKPWECCYYAAGKYYPKKWFVSDDGLRYYL